MNRYLKFVLFGLVSSIVSLNACTGSMPSPIRKGPATYHQRMDLVTGGFQRSYRVYIPSGYDGLTRLPMVVVIHGAFDTAKGMEKFSGFGENAEQLSIHISSDYLRADMLYYHYIHPCWYGAPPFHKERTQPRVYFARNYLIE